MPKQDIWVARLCRLEEGQRVQIDARAGFYTPEEAARAGKRLLADWSAIAASGAFIVIEAGFASRPEVGR